MVNELQERLKGKEVIRIVGAHNALGAKLVEKNGFDAVWSSGFEISSSHALPDASILTMSEFLQSASQINEATNLPVILDADSGYGNVNNIIYLIQKLIKLNIAGVVIEDKVYPKINSYIQTKQSLVSIQEFQSKIKAAKDYSDNKILIFARIESLVAGLGMEETIKRARAYEEAGADGLFIHSKSKDGKEIEEFLERYDSEIPIILCPTSYPSFNLEKIKKYPKVKIVIFANAGIRASVKSMDKIFSKLNKTNDLTSIQEDISTMSELFELQDMKTLKENENKYGY